MQDLHGKTALITGIANKRSIAFAIAETLAGHGARLAIAYQDTEKGTQTKKITQLVETLSPDLMLPLDASEQESVAGMFDAVAKTWGHLDILVHSIASAKREELGGRASDISLDGYLLAQHISAYSLLEMAHHARPLMTREDGGSIITMSYVGAQRASKNYNVMGSAKAALEANMRYLAMELGQENIRVNAISAGPIRTLSASGIKDFLDLLHNAQEKSALKRNVTTQEVASTAAFLASKASSGITGQTIFVDAGYTIFG